MNYIRIRHIATSVGLGTCLYAIVSQKWHQNFLRVNAEPVTPEGAKHPPPYDPGKRKPPAVPPSSDVPWGSVYGPQPSYYDKTLTGIRAEPDPKVKFEQPNQIIPYFKWRGMDELGYVFPHPQEPLRKVLEYKDFLLCYDCEKKTPVWTLERITPNNIIRDTCYLPTIPPSREECRIPPEFRSSKNDYSSAIVMREVKEVHLVDPRFHTDCVADASVYSNVVPQVLEGRSPTYLTLWDEFYDYITFLAWDSPVIYILTGALYLPECRDAEDPDPFSQPFHIAYETIGKGKVAVPTHFFKAILSRREWEPGFRLECFKFKNAHTVDLDISHYKIDRHTLEKQIGFLIFPVIDKKKVFTSTPDSYYIKERLKVRLSTLRMIIPY